MANKQSWECRTVVFVIKTKLGPLKSCSLPLPRSFAFPIGLYLVYHWQTLGSPECKSASFTSSFSLGFCNIWIDLLEWQPTVCWTLPSLFSLSRLHISYRHAPDRILLTLSTIRTWTLVLCWRLVEIRVLLRDEFTMILGQGTQRYPNLSLA